MDKFPTGAGRGLRAICGDPMSWAAEAPELLDVEMEHVARLCQRLGLRHLRTKPYSPQTNGKAERFIQTALREWAYARAYESSSHRARHLPLWLHQYNWHRPHASLQYQPPISRVTLLNNLVGLHI